MARYIDADKIPWRSEVDFVFWRDSKFVEKRDIDNMPTADVVEIVRCKQDILAIIWKMQFEAMEAGDKKTYEKLEELFHIVANWEGPKNGT